MIQEAEPALAGSSDRLFTPFEIGAITLPNRIVMSPMTRSFSPNGIPGKNVAEYYRRRAVGGTGLIISEGTWVPHGASSNNAANPNFFGEESLTGWRDIVEAVHGAGGKIMPQLWHIGLFHRVDISTGSLQAPEGHHIGPSGLSGGYSQPIIKVGEPMTQGHINAVIEAFAVAACTAKALGFDGIELHGGHGYLIDQFLWENTNRRSDQYGGGLVNRSRFAAEIISEIRHRTGPHFPILIRYSQWKQQDYGARLANTPQELEAILAPMVEAGVDLFDCSQRRFWEPAFAESNLNLAGWTRKITGKATMTVGSVGLTAEFMDSMNGEKAEIADLSRLTEMFNETQFDLVGVGRAQLSDPDWGIKVRQARFDELLPFNCDVLNTL